MQENSKTQSDTFQTLIPTKNKAALSAYYLGVFGLIPILGLPLSVGAVALGIVGLKKHQQNPTPGAKGHALAGLILGSIQLLIFVAFVCLMLASKP